MDNMNKYLNQLTDDFRKVLEQIFDCIEETKNTSDTALIQSPTNFLTVKEVANLMGMSEYQARKMFHDPEFPCCDYGKNLVVEDSALKHYFSKPRRKNESPYWRGNKKSN